MMDLAPYIDHTYLRPDCDTEKIQLLCEQAIQHRFAAICIPPYFIKTATNLLANQGPAIATVVGFPMGYAATSAKVQEIKRALEEGATEIDAVVNLCALKSGDWQYVRADIESITRATHQQGGQLKLIVETGLLEENELQCLCQISEEVGVDYVKTSTGINAGGATLEVVQYLRATLPDSIKIKASGGIRSRAEALQFIEAGAARIGTSSAIGMMQ